MKSLPKFLLCHTADEDGVADRGDDLVDEGTLVLHTHDPACVLLFCHNGDIRMVKILASSFSEQALAEVRKEAERWFDGESRSEPPA